MGYEQREPVATCDGCGQALYEGDEAWSCYYDDLNIIVVRIIEIRDWAYHYCCPTPCLERAVVSYVRQLRSVPSTAAQTHPHQEPLS